MSSQIVESPIQYHNQIQLEYFARKIKKTMIPVESPYVMRHIREFIAFSGVTPQDDILEVGCGMGKFTFPMLKHGLHVAGLDLSPFLLQKLLEHNNNRYKIPLIATDVFDAPEEFNGKFDYVVGFFTLHHFHNLPLCFQRMSRLVKPGGKLIFVEPNAWNILYYLQIFFTPGMSWAGDKGVADMRRSKFEEARVAAGLENLEIKTYGFYPPQVINTRFGQLTEPLLEKFPLWKGALPFQLFKMEKPL